MLKNVKMIKQEKQERNTKEVRLTDCGKYNTRIGTVNRKKTDSFYIRSKIKLLNNGDSDELASRLKNVKLSFAKAIERTVRSEKGIYDNTIYDIQYSDSGLTYKNMTYFKYEVFMKPVDTGDFSDKKEYIADIARHLNCQLDSILAEERLK